MKLALGSLALVLLAAIGWLAWPRGDAAAPAGPAATAAPVSDPAVPARTNEPQQREQAIASESAAKEFSGTVRDDAENTIPAASVRVFASPRIADAAPLADVRSDADGRFRIVCDPSWPAALTIEGAAAGHVTQTRDGATPRERADLTLSRLVVLHGRVIAHGTDAPLAGASLRGGNAQVETDGTGRFELTVAMAGGAAYVRVSHAGYVDHGRQIRVHGRQRTEVDFVLQPEVRLTLQVVDAETREPIEGAEVRQQHRDEVVARTDAQGRCSFATGEGQQLRRTVRAAGYGETLWSWQVRDAASVAPRIPLFRPATIEGRVTDQAGNVIEGAAVFGAEPDPARPRLAPVPPGETWAPGTLSIASGDGAAVTDARGRFALAVLPDAVAQTVTVRHDDHVTTTSAPVVVDRAGARAWVELRLERGVTVRGTVRHNGKPWEGFISWRRKDAELGGRSMLFGADEYVLRGVATGDVVLTLRSPGGDDEHTVDLRVGVDEMRSDIAWNDEAPPVPIAITGRVTSTTGAPLAGVRLHATSVGEPVLSFSAGTDEAGRYSIPCTREDLYSLWLQWDAVSRERREMAAGSSDVDFVLPELGLLRLQLVDAATRQPIRLGGDGGPWNLAWRESTERRFLEARDKVDANGRVEMRLPVGAVDFSVWLQRSGYVPRTVSGLRVTSDVDPAAIPIELVRGADIELELAADTPVMGDVANGRLVFVVDDAQSSLLRGPFTKHGPNSNHRINGVVMWLGDPGLMHRLVHFFDDRSVTVRGLAPGRHWLRVFPDDVVFEPATFDVTPAGGKVVVKWRRR